MFLLPTKIFLNIINPMKNLKLKLLPILSIFFLTILCFYNSLAGDFVLDDAFTIVNHELIKSLTTIPKLFTSNYWGDLYPTGLYRPLTSLTYAFNYAMAGLNPWGYHLVNLLFHAFNSLIIYWLVKSYTSKDTLALFTALIFTVHPIHTEAVSNISGRAELLTATFALLSWASYYLSKENFRYYFLSLLFYFFSLIAKESGITLIGVLVLSDLCKYWPSWPIKKLLKGYLGYLAVAGVYIAIRIYILNNLGMPDTWVYWRGIGFSTRFYTMSLAFIKYFQLLIWPSDLVGDYDFSQIPKTSSPNLWVILSLLTIMIILSTGIYLLWKERLTAFAILFFFVTISIVSNIFIPTGIIMAERLLYFPSISICLLSATGLYWLYSKENKLKYLAVFFLTIIIIASVIRTYYRNIDWLSSRNYTESLVRVAPRNIKGLGAIALTYAGEGKYLEAEKLLLQAIEIAPEKATPKGMLGHVYYLQDRYDDAIPMIKKAIEIFPDEDPSQNYLYIDLSRIYQKRKEYKLAIEAMQQAILLSQPDALLHQELATLFFETNDLANAKIELEKAVSINPALAEPHYNLGILLNTLNQPQAAFQHFHLATELEPNNAIARNWYGKALLGQGNFAQAINEFTEVLKLLTPKDSLEAEIYNNLGVAYSQMQRYNEARKSFEKALSIDPNYINATKNLARLNELKAN